MTLYPWQQQDWQRISIAFSFLPNAWLLNGPKGIGKTVFASTVAQALLCEHPTDKQLPCNACQACRWFEAGSHPDFWQLSPENDENDAGQISRKLPVIKIESIRDIIHFAHLSAHRSGRKIILITPAEAMNHQAANALLKILEEPPEQVIFILVSHAKERLLPTIISRCRLFSMGIPNPQQALNWLQQQGISHAETELAYHGGYPLFEYDEKLYQLRRQFIDTVKQPGLIKCLQIAEQIDKHKLPLAIPLEWLSKWVTDLACVKISDSVQYHLEDADALRALCPKLNAQQIFECDDKIKKLIPFGQHTLNVRLQIEALLIEYVRLFSKKKATPDY